MHCEAKQKLVELNAMVSGIFQCIRNDQKWRVKSETGLQAHLKLENRHKMELVGGKHFLRPIFEPWGLLKIEIYEAVKGAAKYTTWHGN